ncbi:MAG: hypothetical protein ABSG96_27325 [Terracidiphilus sp.]|jgi:antitoxin (DNA-binding transcriptional repressor) of toxin-antitoxin stability system
MSDERKDRPMKAVSTEEFELNCLEMIDLAAEKGFTYVITKNGKPIAKLERLTPESEALGEMG